MTDDTLEKATVSSNTSNLSSTANSFVVVEFFHTDLDIANGFTHLRALVASPGANADLIAALYVLGDPHIASGPATHPSAIV